MSSLLCPSMPATSDIGAAEYWPTPEWCTRALLRHAPPPRECTVVEPSAGEGHIAYPLIVAGYAVEAYELRPECRGVLRDIGCSNVAIGDWMAADHGAILGLRTAVVANPPYSQALEFAISCVESAAPYVAMLLPLSFLASQKRAAFHRRNPLRALLVLSKRPSFSSDRRTAHSDYAWYVWSAGPAVAPRVI
jgi:16S rRNA A1518/A1519 N6-dimethyltransferase RsmA/KsgA/DIM1 with predicted DNA glycosylase/AP lyase activity